MKILVAEDDKTIAQGLEYSLVSEGYEVTVCHNKAEALAAVAKQAYDLYLFDLNLPDGSGYELCRTVKSAISAPVIFLTAYDDEVNVVMGLDMGADDYITKPFRIRELLSRIKSALRHYNKTDTQGEVLTVQNITVHTKQAKVYRDGKELPLTAMEYRLLLMFLSHRGQILSRNRLLECIWDVDGDFINDNTLTVYVKRLREKLEGGEKTGIITTVRGLGYRMEE